MRVFVCDQFIIPSSSMEPTLQPGDRIIVNKCIFGPRIYTNFIFDKEDQVLKSVRLPGFRSLRINDIVVFNFPIHKGHMSFKINHVYCKRIVALPGDWISIINGCYRNNNFQGTIGIKSIQNRLAMNRTKHLMEKPLLTISDKNSSSTIYDMEPIYIPHKGDSIRLTTPIAHVYKNIIEYEILETNEYSGVECLRNYHVFKHNYYFMAGDNVFHSSDSRYWGLVPEEYIIGVVDLICYNKNLKSGKYSKDRWIKKL